ncbi:MAG: DUF1343 domain-containing protein [Rhodothermaceae bacterium]|nr:DUF1343 domain-containing protein [Rhodothermaceae bacterium]
MPAPAPASPTDTTATVRTGAQRLVDDGFHDLAGWRVGLITNHTARVDTADGGPVHLIDRLHAAPNVTLAALFGPEHGLRGTAEAGDRVEEGRDAATAVVVHSLYGRNRKPAARHLRDLDALVFDMQDVGARFYTYISTMGLAMQAAAEAGLPFVVLDRPNPIGDRVEGFVMEDGHQSFVGQYAIPVTHGLTVGELARMIQGERLLPGLETLDLRLMEMEGYARGMAWEATGLPWVPPSPNIPDVATARVYPGAALFENSAVNEGRGTHTPFQIVGAPWADGAPLADTLNARELDGVRFEAVTYTPVSLAGMASNPTHRGQEIEGVRLVVTDPAAFRPVATGVHLVHAFYHTAPASVQRVFFNDDWLAKLSGSHRLRRMLIAGEPPAAIVTAWADDVAAFETRRAPYRLYD